MSDRELLAKTVFWLALIVLGLGCLVMLAANLGTLGGDERKIMSLGGIMVCGGTYFFANRFRPWGDNIVTGTVATMSTFCFLVGFRYIDTANSEAVSILVIGTILGGFLLVFPVERFFLRLGKEAPEEVNHG